MSVVLVGAATPIVTADEARAQLRLDNSETDDTINRWIASATRWAENFCGRRLCAGSFVARFDAQPCGPLRIQHAPITEVTAATYLDGEGASQTWNPDTYVVSDFDDRLGVEISLAYGSTWPTKWSEGGGVSIAFTATSPPEAKDAILLMCGSLNANREDQAVGNGLVLINTGAAERLLTPYHIWAV